MSETVNVEAPKGPLRRLYAWMMENARGPHAWWALAAFAFAEASFFPIPPDVMLLPMMLADRRKARHDGGVVHILVGDGRHAGLRHRRAVLEDAGPVADRRCSTSRSRKWKRCVTNTRCTPI